MRSRDHAGHMSYLGIGEVRHIAMNLSALQCLQHVIIVHQKVTGIIQDHNAVLHFLKSLFVQHTSCAVQKRHMNGDVIALLINIIEIGHMLYKGRKLPCAVYGNKRIVAVNLHAEIGSRIGHAGADGAETDDTETLAHDLTAGKILLALLHILADILVVLVFLYPLDSAVDIAGCHEHTGKNQFLYAVGICAGRVEYHDSLFGTFIQGNVVDTGSGSGDGFQPFGQLHLMHIGAADKNRIRIRQIFCNRIIIRKEFQALLGDLIQAMNLCHLFFLRPHIICCAFPQILS